MGALLNQLGLLMAGRRPGGFPGARTPGINPNQPYPYPTAGAYPYPPAGTGSGAELPPQDPNQPRPAEEDKPFLRSVYEGLVKNPMGPAFTLAMANSLTAPLRPGQTEMGKWIEGITQGYNTLGSLAQLRAQQATLQRRERREDIKLGQEQEKIQTEQQKVFNQQGQAEATQELNASKAAETASNNKATREQNERQHKERMTAAEQRAKVAEKRFEIQMKRLEEDAALKEKELKLRGEGQADTKEYRKQMAKAALQTSGASMLRARATADALKAGYKPEQVALMERIANDEAELMMNTELLGGSADDARKALDGALARVKARFDAQTGKGTTNPPASNLQYKEGDTASNAQGKQIIFRGGKWVPK